MLPVLNLCRTKSRPQILHAVPRLQFGTKIKCSNCHEIPARKMLVDGMVVPCRLGMADHIRWVRSSLYTQFIRSDWTTDATHMLPQPDHVGSAVIRYVSLGLPGFGSFEWDEPRGLVWLAGLLVVWGYRTANR